MGFIRCLFLALILLAQAGSVFDVALADEDKQDHRYRNRHRERHGDDFKGKRYLKAVSDPIYKENCGSCHFAYQPELLPSVSWEIILNRPENHFGESLELDAKAKSAIWGYLQPNAAEHSTSKVSVKIMRRLGNQVPNRISEIPYIRGKHHEIPAAIVERPSIGSLSNCTACHAKAQEGIYDDDFVAVPK